MDLITTYIKDCISKTITNQILIDLHDAIRTNPNLVSYHDTFEKTFTLFLNEDIPLSEIFTTEVTEAIDNYVNLYENKTKKFKTKKLIELYNIKVYFGNSKYVSYKDKTNIESEVRRIFNNARYSDLKIFLDQIIPDNTSHEKEYADEFLNINETLPRMISTSRIKFYSSLLNKEKLDSTTIAFLDPENTLGLDLLEWDELSDSFNEFLADLSSRTINYK